MYTTLPVALLVLQLHCTGTVVQQYMYIVLPYVTLLRYGHVQHDIVRSGTYVRTSTYMYRYTLDSGACTEAYFDLPHDIQDKHLINVYARPCQRAAFVMRTTVPYYN